MGTQALTMVQPPLRRERRPRITNRWCWVRFLLDGQEFERQLVNEVRDPGTQVNVASPVGEALLLACEGEELQVKVPGGCVVVKVLEIRA